MRQASFPFHISQICLLFSSCGYIEFAFHTPLVLEVDLRQATILTSYRTVIPFSSAEVLISH